MRDNIIVVCICDESTHFARTSGTGNKRVKQSYKSILNFSASHCHEYKSVGFHEKTHSQCIQRKFPTQVYVYACVQVHVDVHELTHGSCCDTVLAMYNVHMHT
jgi:hypothetical protein